MNEAVLVTKAKGWTKADRERYGGATVRILGDRDHRDQVLVEIMSGPLTGCRIWATEAELVRQEAAE